MVTQDQAASSPIPVKLAGETWMLSPIRAQDAADFVRWVRLRHVTHWRTSLAGMDPDFVHAEVSKAVAESAKWTAASPEILQYMADFEGLAYMLFLCLRRHHPEVTIDKAQELMCNPKSLVPDPELIDYVREQLELLEHLETLQEPSSKKANGLRRRPHRRKRRRKRQQIQCTSSSRNGTDGDLSKSAR